MRVLHLAAGNRWTGAAAPAFAEVEALRAAGVDAHYAYVGGYKLETKLKDVPFAHPLIEKAQNPVAARRTVRALESLGSFDVVHAHLTYDHVLGAMLARRIKARLARTYHSERVLRRDPFSLLLQRQTPLRFVINETFSVPGATFTPPPVDHREFTPDGENVRARYGIDPQAPVAVSIGKLTHDRGFELALQSFAVVRRTLPNARMIIIGHGPHQNTLEVLGHALGLDVIFAGYHEDDLAEHYRAADALLFTARGSDEGHRAILEAMACGVVPVSAPIPGVEALVRGLDTPLIAATSTPEAIAMRLTPILAARGILSKAAVRQSQQFGYAPAAERLMQAYGAAPPAQG
ncbi:MAG TPA: glycosyltransferase family 4 protein [Thermoanaerobaculia bacterium]|nr:glycosyltransferase family 4 protein [Thermoanaerobaculia bacterium]